VLAAQERISEAHDLCHCHGHRHFVPVDRVHDVDSRTERRAVAAAHVQDAWHRPLVHVGRVRRQLYGVVQHSVAVQWSAGGIRRWVTVIVFHRGRGEANQRLASERWTGPEKSPCP